MQTLKEQHKLWMGSARASLVIVEGNTPSGSPSFLYTKKDGSGNPLMKTLKLEWEFERRSSGTDRRQPVGLAPEGPRVLRSSKASSKHSLFESNSEAA